MFKIKNDLDDAIRKNTDINKENSYKSGTINVKNKLTNSIIYPDNNKFCKTLNNLDNSNNQILKKINNSSQSSKSSESNSDESNSSINGSKNSSNTDNNKSNIDNNSKEIFNNSNNIVRTIKTKDSLKLNNTNDIYEELQPSENYKMNKNDGNKINNSCIQNNFYNEKIYIKNLNIYENKSLNGKDKSEEKRYSFKNLEISSESTLDIYSSYENINKLTNYSYISDNDLRQKTKKFLFRECGKQFSEKNLKKVNPNVNKSARKSLSSDLIINLLSNKKLNDKIVQKNNVETDTLKSFQSLNHNKFNKFRMSVIKGNDFLQKLNSDIGGKESNNDNRPIYKMKKIKEKKEMFMISNNIKRNTQNLNNPELFYTGLFHNILEKQKQKNNLSIKSKTISSKIKNKKYKTKSTKKRK